MGTELWSYSTGRRGQSRVRVYERVPGGPIQVEFSGGDRQTLTNMQELPVTDRELAKKIADALSRRLEAGSARKVAREVLGLEEARTLSELLKSYHEDMTPEWGESHRVGQERLQKWWLSRLGAKATLHTLTEGDVERAIRLDVGAKGWSARTRQKYLRYIMAAFAYGHRKLKWIVEGNQLTGIALPRPSRGGPAYTHGEMIRLLNAAPGVDVRAAAALEVAYDTQARSKAILHLRPQDYRGDGLLQFWAEFDKAGKDRTTALSPTATRHVEALVEAQKDRPWLFEEGGRRMPYDSLLRLLRAVEKAAGVPHLEGRGIHAVKRRSVTDARRAVGDMGAVAKQSGTLASTLERIYEQDDMEPKRAVAAAMERLRKEG